MVELDQLVDEVLLASRLDAREADIGTIEAEDLVGLCAEESARVRVRLAVAKLLRRMVRNLLENARRYGATTPEDLGSVLSLRSENQQVWLTGADSGPGVPLE